jgi:membrane protease subunit HflC
MKRNPITIAVGAVLLLIFILLLFLFQVRQTQVAVVTTFGKATRPITEPGLKFRLPWPIQNVYKFDQRINSLESGIEQVQTSDGYSLLVQVYAGWKISEPQQFFPRFAGSTNQAIKSLQGLLRNAYSGVVGKYPFSAFISTDPKNVKLAEIEQEMLQRVQADARANTYGIEIKFLGIKRLGLPESVTKLVFDTMKSERERLASAIESDGRRQAIEIRSKADSESAKTLAEAEAQATIALGKAEKEAATSFGIFNQEPELAMLLLKLKALEDLLQSRTTLILDDSTIPVDLLRSVPRPGEKKN